jgi:hypothetical protein
MNAITNSSKKMFIHLRKLHKPDQKFESRCLFSREWFHESDFKSFGGLERHLRTFHPNLFKSSLMELSEEIPTFTEPDNGNNSAVSIGMHFKLRNQLTLLIHNMFYISETDLPPVELTKPADVNLKDLGAEFVLKLLTEQKVTQVNVQYVMETAKILINETVKQKLQKATLTLDFPKMDAAAALSRLLASSENPFALVRNQYSQNNYFTKHFVK